MKPNPARLFRLIQLADSALPVGGFSFSGGVETATGEGLIVDTETLESYLHTSLRNTATLDGVAALVSFRAACKGHFEGIRRADCVLWSHKAGEESRQMCRRMGHRLSELGRELLPGEPLVERWLAAIRSEEVKGCHAVGLGLLFARAGLDEESLFTALLYGVASQLTGAALRTLRISHLTTQQLLFRCATHIPSLYASAAMLQLDEMHRFTPETEILASLHERGHQRLFMN